MSKVVIKVPHPSNSTKVVKFMTETEDQIDVLLEYVKLYNRFNGIQIKSTKKVKL